MNTRIRKTSVTLISLFAWAVVYGQDNGLGAKLLSPERFASLTKAKSPFSGSETPKHVDLSEDLPPPGRQGKQNSCVAWATAYGVRSYQERKAQEVKRKPEKWPLTGQDGTILKGRVFSPAYIYNQINNNLDQGSFIPDALNKLKDEGCAVLEDFPYDPGDYRTRPDAQTRAKASRYRIDNWSTVDPRDIFELKIQLAAGYPIIFGARIDDGFRNLGSRIWNETEFPSGTHAMVVIGYDDTKAAFKVLNSWGEDWGDRGYGWISYNLFRSVANEAYIIKALVNDKVDLENPQPRTRPQITPDAGSRNSRVNITSSSRRFENGTNWIVISGTAKPGQNRGTWAMVVVHFYYENGRREIRSYKDSRYADKNGWLTTGTKFQGLDPSRDDTFDWEAWVPSDEVSAEMSRILDSATATANIGIIAEAELFVDNYGVATSPNFITFQYRYSGSFTPGTTLLAKVIKDSRNGNVYELANYLVTEFNNQQNSQQAQVNDLVQIINNQRAAQSAAISALIQIMNRR